MSDLTRSEIVAVIRRQVARARSLLAAAEAASAKRGRPPAAAVLDNHGAATGEELEMAQALVWLRVIARNVAVSGDPWLVSEGMEILHGVLADDRGD